jgi:hypothetical protein
MLQNTLEPHTPFSSALNDLHTPEETLQKIIPTAGGARAEAQRNGAGFRAIRANST